MAYPIIPNNDDDFAPADVADFYLSVAGVIIDIDIPLADTLEFKSEDDFELVLPGETITGKYSYQKTGSNSAKLEVDAGDIQLTIELEYVSHTKVAAKFDLNGLSATVNIDLQDRSDETPAGSGNVATGSVTFTGTTDDDSLPGSSAADILNGLEGDDVLEGLAGDDVLNGGPGDDTLVGGAGADMLDGGAGGDTADYSTSPRSVLVRLHDARAVRFGDAEGDTLTGIEHLTGSKYNDILAGDGEDNILKGEDGDDTLYGGPAGGDDEMHGGNGDDRIYGGKGNDTLIGGEGNDLLKGGAGDDTLVIDGNAMDVVHGGPGDDTFVFSPSNIGGATISDFTRGEDVIDLTAFTGISSVEDLEDNMLSLGGNGRIELSGTQDGAEYLTTIILTGFDVANLDNSDFMFYQ